MQRSPEVERLTLGDSLSRILSEAEDIARQVRARPHSGHVLLAYFVVDQAGRRLLEEMGIDEDGLLDRAIHSKKEERSAMRALMERAAMVAASCGARTVEPLHLLVAMTRQRSCLAHTLLEGTGRSLASLRSRVLAVLTAPSPRWVESRVSQRPHVRHQRTGPLHSSTHGVSVTTSAPAPRNRAADSDPTLPSTASTRSAKTKASPASMTGYQLDPERYPWLTSLGRNLTAEAAEGRLDPLVGRRREIEQVIDILGKRRANNPCLVGDPGVGKTAVVEGLALEAINHAKTAGSKDWIIVALDVGSLLVGTHLRGSFSEKLQGLKEEVSRSEGRVIVFLDELHTLVGAGSSGDGPLDAANELKTALARGEFPCIGATTHDEYRKFIEADPALSRRFTPVRVDEPSPSAALDMLYQLAPSYAAHHGVGFTQEALQAAVRLSIRHLPNRRLPDKAIGLLDLAGSRAARSGLDEVTPRLLAELIAERYGVPLERVLTPEAHRLLDLEERLAERIVGHQLHIRNIADSIRRHAAGFGGTQPQSVFLFLGPTGVGKTETAKALAEVLFGPGDNLIRFDFNDFAEPHAAARLIGAPPGYVGHEGGGQLTEAIHRNPSRVVLFDEVEKAHPEVLAVLLTLLDEGRLTDARGRTFSFSESVIVMTSNAGVVSKKSVGFESASDPIDPARVLKTAATHFSPELWGRIPEKLVFQPLGVDEHLEILRRMVRASSDQLQRERGITFALDEGALGFVLHQTGTDAGTRPLRQSLRTLVEGPIARRILEGRLHADEDVWVTTRSEGGLRFLVGSGESLSLRPGGR
ncbi:MAG: AAA family ATPase [Myxococcota bacterium]